MERCLCSHKLLISHYYDNIYDVSSVKIGGVVSNTTVKESTVFAHGARGDVFIVTVTGGAPVK